MGGIGSAVATRAKAFGMKIQYHNRRQLPPTEEHGATYVTFEELLKTSDVLSLNLALNPSTKHIIGKPEFDQMKDGIVIVNTARGALIDEAALVDALKSGKVWTAGLDVFEDEPEIHPGLLECENAVLLPHVGTATFETQVSATIAYMNSGLTFVARYGAAGLGKLDVGNQGREADHASAGAERQGKPMILHYSRCRLSVRVSERIDSVA